MKPYKIMIVEDEESDFLLIERHIQQSGLNTEITMVRDEAGLSAALKDSGWGVVLSDYKVVGLDFMDTLNRINRELPDVPVILVSGSVGEDTAVDLLRNGISDFVLKDRLQRLVPAIERSINEKEREHRYRKLSQEYRTLLDNVPDGIVHLSLDMKIRWVNAGARKMFNLNEDSDLSDRLCCSVFWGTDEFCEPCPVRRCFVTQKNEVGDYASKNDNRQFEIRAVPLVDEKGKMEGVIEIIRDITVHRNLEGQLRQAQKMESIGTFAGGIAHDFNNILSAILGYGELALEGLDADSPNRENVDQIMEAGLRASHLTRDLLLFSRKQVIDKHPVDINLVIMKIEKFICRIIGEDVECRTHLSSAPLMIMADAHQIEQLLMNFATNSRDAMPNGGEFSISTEAVTFGGNHAGHTDSTISGPHVLITVSDSGTGMDPVTAGKIFEPFFTTKKIGKGTGLGMSVVYGIVKNHQGCIQVRSELSKGTDSESTCP